MDGLVISIRLKLNDYFICHKQIRRIIPNNNTFKLDFYQRLQIDFYTTQLKFHLHRPLVNAFKKSITQDIMYFKCSANELFGDWLKRIIFRHFYLCFICGHLWLS